MLTIVRHPCYACSMNHEIRVAFRLPIWLHTRLTAKVPKKGDLSAIMRKLVALYVEDKVKVPPIIRP